MSRRPVADERYFHRCACVDADRATESGRYRGLVVSRNPSATIQATDSALLGAADKAQEQVEEDRAAAQEEAAGQAVDDGGVGSGGGGPVGPARAGSPASGAGSDLTPTPADPLPEAAISRFFGSVTVDPHRYSRDIGNVTREVIDRLAGAGARLEITIDIQAAKPEGFDEAEVRTISENARVLKFNPSSGFEKG